MDTLENYRTQVKTLIQTIAPPSDDEIDSQIISDTEGDHYQLSQVG